MLGKKIALFLAGFSLMSSSIFAGLGGFSVDDVQVPDAGTISEAVSGIDTDAVSTILQQVSGYSDEMLERIQEVDFAQIKSLAGSMESGLETLSPMLSLLSVQYPEYSGSVEQLQGHLDSIRDYANEENITAIQDEYGRYSDHWDVLVSDLEQTAGVYLDGDSWWSGWYDGFWDWWGSEE